MSPESVVARPMLKAIVLLGVLLIAGVTGLNAPEAQLWNDLMTSTNYNKLLRPVLDNPNKQLIVSFFFSLARLESLNEKTQVMTTFGWMGMSWKDELLRWDPSTYNNLYKLVVPGEQIWLPEIAMLNSVEQGNDLSMESKFRAVIYPDGTVMYAPGFKWKTSCTVDLVSFPYDTQICSVVFVNWVYQAALLNFTIADPVVDVNSYEPNGQWDLLSANVTREDMQPGKGFHIPSIAFSLELKRKPAFFEANVVIPCLLMTMMSALVFYLPAESGEKIGLGITVLLSYSVILLMVSDITPRSNSMPLISIYIVLSMGLTALSLIGTIVVLNIYHQNPEKPVPRWLKTLMLKRVASALCMTSNKDTGDTSVHPAGGITPGNGHKNDIKVEDLTGYTKTGKPSGKQVVTASSIPKEIEEYFQSMKQKAEEDDILEANRAEWQRVSCVLDRLFFVLFGLVITACTVTIVSMIMGKK